jgi:hypothetical protein
MPLGAAGDRVRTGAMTVAEVPLTLTLGAGRPRVFGATGIGVNSPGAGIAVGDTTGELSGGGVFVGVGVGVCVGVGVGSTEHIEISTGEGALAVVPLPIWPKWLRPQHLTLHSAIHAQE